MLFNSIDFAIFFPLVFLFYWFVFNRKLKNQNIFIVGVSYLFYGWWNWKFLSLILFSTIVDYAIGLALKNENNNTKRKALLWVSICVNIGFLGFFKYYNFFLENFIAAFTLFGNEIQATSLNVVLPVGISFYTFQTLSYTIDVYKRKLAPTKDFVSFAAFVSFFPQLVAGPIERATHLLPQFQKKRQFDYGHSINGLRQILWGLFKKIVIADNCAEIVNIIFSSPSDFSGSTLFIGALLFAFQIYGDFSGYSDIAIGSARLLGFDLMKNFAFPYFSRDIAEFWRRWHISLSTWFRDYLYIPLGGSKGNTWMQVRNIFVIFIVSGLWHGADWTFIVWGALNAAFFLPLFLLKRNRHNLEIVAQGKNFPPGRDLLNILLTFGLTVLAWVFFRAESMSHALSYLNGIFSSSLFSFPTLNGINLSTPYLSIILGVLLIFFIIIEWLGREDSFALASFGNTWKRHLRWGFYYLLIIIIFTFSGQQQEFIYFQF